MGSFYERTKTALSNEEILARLKNSKKSLESIAKWLKVIGGLAGAKSLNEIPSIKDIKELIKSLKSGIKVSNSMMLIVAATAAYMEGVKLENGAAQIQGVINSYIELHSSAANPNSTPAKGVYEITTTSVSAGTGGGGYHFSTSYYDITTKQFLGEIHGN